MARLIEFFTKGEELVLDPFAGVGGACWAPPSAGGRGARSASSWSPAGRRGLRRRGPGDAGASSGTAPGRCWRTWGPTTRVDIAASTPQAAAWKWGGDAPTRLLSDVADASIDFVATDPPYNPQLKLTMAGGRLAEAHANRRTDYAMVTDDPGGPRQQPILQRVPGAHAGAIFVELRRVLRDQPVRGGHRA